MKKMLSIVLLISVMMAMFSTAAYAVGCTHENSVYDTTRENDEKYTDCGDYHEIVQWYPRICFDCGEQFWETDNYVYVEGHNLALTNYDRNHNPGGTHSYTFTCLDCKHLVIILRECDGPPCEAIYLPAMIDELSRE